MRRTDDITVSLHEAHAPFPHARIRRVLHHIAEGELPVLPLVDEREVRYRLRITRWMFVRGRRATILVGEEA